MIDVGLKLARRYARGECIACGHKVCSCKTKGKLRNHPKGIGRAEMREPSMTIIRHEAGQLSG